MVRFLQCHVSVYDLQGRVNIHDEPEPQVLHL